MAQNKQAFGGGKRQKSMSDSDEHGELKMASENSYHEVQKKHRLLQKEYHGKL